MKEIDEDARRRAEQAARLRFLSLARLLGGACADNETRHCREEGRRGGRSLGGGDDKEKTRGMIDDRVRARGLLLKDSTSTRPVVISRD